MAENTPPRKPRTKKVETSIKKVTKKSPTPMEKNVVVPTPGVVSRYKYVAGIVVIVAAVWASFYFWPAPEPAPDVPTPPIVVVPEKKVEAPAIVDSKKYAITLQKEDGTVEKRFGGSVSWRQNNPGLLAHGAHAKSHGSLGDQNSAAVFPTLAAGRKALESYLFETDSKHQSIGTVLSRVYSKEPTSVLQSVLKATGVPSTTKLGNLRPEQRTKLVSSLEAALEFRPGTIKTFNTVADWKAAE